MAVADEPGTTIPNSWLYQVEWQTISPATASGPVGRWLVVRPPGSGWADEWTAALSAHDTTVVRLADGTERDAVAEALRRAAAAGPVDGVLSLLAAAQGPDPRHPSVPAGVLGTLVLIQALGDAGITAPLWCLTSGAVSVGPEDPVTRPEPAQVWGLGHVARLEHPDRWGGLVDVPARPGDGGTAPLWEILTGRDGEDQVALRPTGAYGRRVAPAPPPTASPAWRPGGTALVVGGTGALGGQVARWLAAHGCDHVVLVARDAARGDLEGQLAALGTKVTFRGCDVADRAAVAALAADLRAGGTEVRSVFHCAGAAQSTGLAEMTPAEFAEVTSAKTAGAAHLDHAFGAGLDAFVLFGCFPGVWGSYGRGAAVAADAFLDAFARWRRAEGRTATTIAWGAWAVGRTLDDTMLVEQLRRGGVTPLPADAALAAMADLIGSGRTGDLVIDLDWPRFASVFTARRPSRLIGHLAGRPGRGLAELPRGEREVALFGLVRVEVAAVLGLSRPDLLAMDRSLARLGCDADALASLAAALGRTTGLALPPGTVDGPVTPAGLAAALGALLPAPPATEEV